MRRFFLAACLLALSGQAAAQSTTCMNMGSNMATCNTVGERSSSTSHCMRHGDIVTCNTIGSDAYSNDDSGAALGAGLVSFVRSIGERNFRKKIGAFLTAGDCEGAVAYAFEKGRIELGRSLARECEAQTVSQEARQPVNRPYEEIAYLVGRAAETYPANFELGEGVVVRRFLADGGTLVLESNVTEDSNTDGIREVVCGSRALLAVLSTGATVAFRYGDKELKVSRGDCGV